jgi:(d)CTP diphosphatase
MNDPPIPATPGRRGAIGVVLRAGRFLVVERSRTVVAPGKLCFPGGGIEPGETPEEALVREFFEELGTAVRPVRFLWENTTPWQVHLSWWLAELTEDAEMNPNPAEVAAVHWMTIAELESADAFLESNRPFLGRLGALAARMHGEPMP